MSTGDKKWILDFSPAIKSIETPQIEFDASDFKSLPESLLQIPLFIDSVTWLPMTIENAFERLKSVDYAQQAGYKLFFNSVTISFVTLLNKLLLSPSPHIVFQVSFTMQCMLSLLQKSSSDAEISKRTLEMLEELLSVSTRLQPESPAILTLQILKSLRLLLKTVGEFPLDFRIAWKKSFFDSPTRNSLAFHPIAEIAAEYLSLDILMAVFTHENATLPNSVVQKLASSIPNDPSKISDFLSPITLLAAHSTSPFISGNLSTYLVQELSQKKLLENRLDVLKIVEPSDFISSTLSLLMSHSAPYDESCIQALEFWLNTFPDYPTAETVLDEVTVRIKNGASVLNSNLTGAKLLLNVKNRMTRSNQWRYIHHWLTTFGEINDLDLVLTQVGSLEEIKPHVNVLEIGLSILHYITPSKSEICPIESSTLENSEKIDAQDYHCIMNLLLQRMDVPDYFFYLGETRDYDQDNFKFNDLRVKTFQHLIGHYWYLMDSFIADMPEMTSLTRDNPIVLLPAGVSAPTEVPPWMDSLLVLMGIHAMPSDFATKETYLDVKKTTQTLLTCESVKSLKKSPFALRIRQCIHLTKSRQSQLLDDAAKFSILTWLCRQVPLHELSPNTDTYDGVVVNTVVKVINEVLGDHRPRIKVLAIHLVLAICNQKRDASSDHQPASILLPRATFDAIVRSLNFREVPFVEMALKACMALIKSRMEKETQVAWAQSLMHSINYEMDYIQKKDLLVIYLEHLKCGILSILGIQIFLFSHPLMLRLVSLLDIGDFELTRLALENIAHLMRLAWPRIHLEAELIFGALGAVWIDQVLILPTDAAGIHSERVQNNIGSIKDRIQQCLLILFQILEPKLSLQMAAQVAPLPELKPFYDLTMGLIKAKQQLD
jgi:hypothetical protein